MLGQTLTIPFCCLYSPLKGSRYTEHEKNGNTSILGSSLSSHIGATNARWLLAKGISLLFRPPLLGPRLSDCGIGVEHARHMGLGSDISGADYAGAGRLSFGSYASLRTDLSRIARQTALCKSWQVAFNQLFALYAKTTEQQQSPTSLSNPISPKCCNFPSSSIESMAPPPVSKANKSNWHRSCIH